MQAHTRRVQGQYVSAVIVGWTSGGLQFLPLTANFHSVVTYAFYSVFNPHAHTQQRVKWLLLDGRLV